MQFQDFIDQEFNTLDNFRHWYESRRKRSPSAYPAFMSEREWQRAFRDYKEHHGEAEDHYRQRDTYPASTII